MKILIVGAGIAGPAAAFWLARHGHDCTVVERFPSLRAAGLQVDLRNEAIEVVRRMGLLAAVRARSVPEMGTIIVDARGHEKVVQRRLEHDFEHGRQGRTSAYEILRRDMVQILYDATKDRVRYRFGVSVHHYRNIEENEEEEDEDEDEEEKEDEDEDNDAHNAASTSHKHKTPRHSSPPSVLVTLSDGSVESYDLLIAADGQASRIRKQMLFYTPELDHSRWLGIFSAYYTLPRREYDTGFARLYHAPGRRLAMTRWHTPTTGQAYLMAMTDEERFRRALEFKGTRGGTNPTHDSTHNNNSSTNAPKTTTTTDHDTAAQRQVFISVFRGMGWQEERLLRALEDADDFYADEMIQRCSDVWHRGRVVLLGDAAYCASPIAGVGCSMALIGAYVLAGELALRFGSNNERSNDKTSIVGGTTTTTTTTASNKSMNDNKSMNSSAASPIKPTDNKSLNSSAATPINPTDSIDQALSAYHATLLPLAEKSQRLPKRSLQAWLPLSTWSIRGLHLREWARSKGWQRLAVQPWARSVVRPHRRDEWVLPDYPEMCWRTTPTSSGGSSSRSSSTRTTTMTSSLLSPSLSSLASSSVPPPPPPPPPPPTEELSSLPVQRRRTMSTTAKTPTKTMAKTSMPTLSPSSSPSKKQPLEAKESTTPSSISSSSSSTCSSRRDTAAYLHWPLLSSRGGGGGGSGQDPRPLPLRPPPPPPPRLRGGGEEERHR